MNARQAWIPLLPISALLLASCGEKESSTTATSPETGLVQEEAAVAQAILAEELSEKLSAAERAEMLGFAGHLSPDIDGVLSVFDGRGLVEGIRSLKFWELTREVIEEEAGVDPEEMAEEGAGQANIFLGDELFMAFGDGTSEQMGIYNDLQARMAYYQFRMMSRAFAEGVASDEVEEALSSMEENDWMKDMAGDIGKFMPWIESVEVPPMLIGLKVTDEESRKMAGDQLSGLISMFGGDGDAVTFEKGGASFSGVSYSGEMMVEEMEGDREEVDEVLGKETTDKIIEAVAKKKVVVAMGTLDDYLLLYLGGSEEDCPLVDSVEESLVAGDTVRFIDEFKDQPVHVMFYGSKGLAESSVRQGLKHMAEGLRDGMTGVDGFGDTRELVALLDLVGERESALLELCDSESVAGVMRIDDGVVFETFGGVDTGALNYDQSHSLGALGEGEGVLLFGNWIAGQDYSDRSSELMELMAEVTYAMAQHLAGLDIDSEVLAKFNQGFGMFDGMFRSDLVNLWDGMSTMSEGLGNEAAMVVDLNAPFPPIPGVPRQVVEDGRFFRASYVAPVKEREKLGESWKTIDASIRGILNSVSEMGIGEFSMLSPTSAEKNDLVTWYFDALAYSDDLKPSVTVNDDWFVASTSRTQAQDLVAGISSKAETVRNGAWMRLDLDVLRSYLKEAVVLVDREGEHIFDDGEDLAEFRETLPELLRGIEAMDEVVAVTLHSRVEGGSRRMTLHFDAR